MKLRQNIQTELNYRESLSFEEIFLKIQQCAKQCAEAREQEWQSLVKEFRRFVRSTGIRLTDLDKYINRDLMIFLIDCYHIIRRKASTCFIDSTYGYLLGKIYDLFISEVYNLVRNKNPLMDVGSSTLHAMLLGVPNTGAEFDDAQLPKCGVVRLSLLMVLAYRASNREARVEAILCTLFTPHAECSPEEVAGYLFGLKEEGLPVLKHVLNALMEVLLSPEIR